MRRATDRHLSTLLTELEQDLREPAAEITRATRALDGLLADDAPVSERRAAHRRLRLAYEQADRLLRAATREVRAARPRSVVWSRLRSRLAELDTQRQLHLVQERDDLSVLALGEVQALDTGMSGPAIGELQHGGSVPTGAPAAYGDDLDTVLALGPVARPAAFTSRAFRASLVAVPPPEDADQRCSARARTSRGRLSRYATSTTPTTVTIRFGSTAGREATLPPVMT